jgi:DNA repair exonuclease SbcCD nuclease subunit
MPIKILATADLHLGRSAADVTGSFVSTKFIWQRIIAYCIDNQVDVLALCGDIVDWDNRYFEAVGPLQKGFEELHQHGIAVYMVSGNHDFDVLAGIASNTQLPNVHLIGKQGQWDLQQFKKGEQIVQFAGWSFPARSVKVSAFLDYGLPGYDSKYPCIGLLHGDINKPGSEYHPFTLDELTRSEVNLWLLGHIHKPGRLNVRPDVFYLGSPQAMSAKEPDGHGVLLAEVSESGTIAVSQVLLSPVLYTTLEIEVTANDDEPGLRDRITNALVADGLEKEQEMPELQAIVYQLKLTGEHTTINEVERWTQQVLQYNQQLTRASISVRKVYNRLKPALQNLEELAASNSPAGVLANTILEYRKGTITPFLEGLIADWKQKSTHVYQSGTYTPLVINRRVERPGDAEAMNYILQECNRLLAELNGQIN